MKEPIASRNGALVARARAFDDLASRFLGLVEVGIAVIPLWGPRLRRVIPFIEGPRVLEVSFGSGYLLSQYAARFETTGVDYNPRMVEAAQRRLSRLGVAARLVHGDVHDLPFPDASFDCLVNTDAFTLYEHPERAMSEMFRVLAPGGRLVMLEYDWPSDGNWLGRALMWLPRLLGMPYVAFDPLFRAVGFEHESHPVGLAGVLHLFVATKPPTASGRSAAPARS